MITYLGIQLPSSLTDLYSTNYIPLLWNIMGDLKSWSTIPKLKGGIGLPDLRKYHQACHLARIIDWTIHSKVKALVQLEHSLSSLPLYQTPWISPKHTPLTSKNHPLINPKLLSFRESYHQKITSISSPMTPLCHNPEFPPGTSTSFLMDSWPHPTVRGEHLYENGHLITQAKLATQMTNGMLPFWTYMQIRHFLEKPKPKPDLIGLDKLPPLKRYA